MQAYDSAGLSSKLSQRAVAVLEVPLIGNAGIVRLHEDWWQLSFMAYPPDGLSIVSGSVVTPTGATRTMNPWKKDWSIRSAFWSISEPEPGTYNQTVKYDSGQFAAKAVEISSDMFTGI